MFVFVFDPSVISILSAFVFFYLFVAHIAYVKLDIHCQPHQYPQTHSHIHIHIWTIDILNRANIHVWLRGNVSRLFGHITVLGSKLKKYWRGERKGRVDIPPYTISLNNIDDIVLPTRKVWVMSKACYTPQGALTKYEGTVLRGQRTRQDER